MPTQTSEEDQSDHNVITKLTAYFMCGLMSDLVISKKNMVTQDIKCPY